VESVSENNFGKNALCGTRVVTYFITVRLKDAENKEKQNNTLKPEAMKKMMFILMLMMATTLSTEAHRYYRPHVSISMQSFYDELSPYGDWIYTYDYGYVWRPYFDNPYAFRPYSSGGNWAYTEYGWTWVSDYRWGWAPFHYGRWYFDDYMGWMWIPGYEWAPAWVSWGSYNDYYGWAPMGPNIYVSVNFNWFAPDPWWTFVPRRHFCSPHWHSYIYDRPVHVTNITQINNIYYNDNRSYRNENNWFNGPRVSDVERYGNTRVRQMKVVDTERPDRTLARNGQVSVYRPTVDRNRNESRPAEYRNAENARSSSRISQQNPRSNDPGNIRTRDEMKSADRTGHGSTRDYNSIQTRTNRVEPGNPGDNTRQRTSTEVKTTRMETPAGQRNEKTYDNNRTNGNSRPSVETKPVQRTETEREAVNRSSRNESPARQSTEIKRNQENRNSAPRQSSQPTVERKQEKSQGSDSGKSRNSDRSSERSSHGNRNR